jgi:ubiquinone/menaquinone biosynthesis C-methylase UbiE
MSGNVDLYNSSYGNPDVDAYHEVRVETYGEDYGQTSWMNSEEFHEIPHLLGLTSASMVLEIGSGAGGCGIHLAGALNCRVIGLDVNAEGVRLANQRAKIQRLDALVRFEEVDASKRLPFEENVFDGAYCNDAICHLPNRTGVIAEIRRVLKPGGRLLFSDALVIAGLVTSDELARRSSVGFYVFAAAGENERLIAEAGMELLQAVDTTANVATISKRWHDARFARRFALVPIEGESNFNNLQDFLKCVHTVSSEKRMLRFLYLARK